jgi:hypothetical protein
MHNVTKKLLALTLIGTMLIATGCGAKTSSKTTETKKETTTAKKATEKTYKIGDEVKINDFTYKVNGLKTATSVGVDDTISKAKHKFLIISITATNNGKEPTSPDVSNFTLQQDGKSYEASGEASYYADTKSDNNNDSFLNNQINPDDTLSSSIVFDVQDNVINGNDLSIKIKAPTEPIYKTISLK